MGINFLINHFSVGLPQKIELNTKNRLVSFGNNPYGDSFQSTSVEKFFDEKVLLSLIAKNKELKQILHKNNIPVKLNIKEIKDLQENHCKDTQNICAEIYKNLPPAIKNQVNLKNLKDAALLHDIGKVLIPPEILNKAGQLSEQERKIMDLHTVIGYELLKNSNINPEVLYLIKNHHSAGADASSQILNIADKYSALIEKRVYKDAMTPKQALTILNSEKEIHPIILYTLARSVNTKPSQHVLNVS